MFMPYRCRLCGETYLGEAVPDRCPYCGAAGRQMVPAAEWSFIAAEVVKDPATLDLCRQALDLEISNASFYQKARHTAELAVNSAIFARLSKQELEHAEAFARLLGQQVPPLRDENAPADDGEKFAEAHRREIRALKLYQDAANRATPQNVQELFRVLSEIELEHLRVSNVMR